MYCTIDDALSSNVLTFENETVRKNKAASWQVLNKDDGQGDRLVYKKTNAIESYQTNFIDIVKESTTWYGTPMTTIQGTAIQFKTKRGRGNYAIRLLDTNGNKVTALKLHGDEKFFFSSSRQQKDLKIIQFTLNNTQSNNTWQTHTI